MIYRCGRSATIIPKFEIGNEFCRESGKEELKHHKRMNKNIGCFFSLRQHMQSLQENLVVYQQIAHLW